MTLRCYLVLNAFDLGLDLARCVLARRAPSTGSGQRRRNRVSLIRFQKMRHPHEVGQISQKIASLISLWRDNLTFI